MKKIIVNGEEKYIDDEVMSKEEMGYVLDYQEDELEQTQEIKKINTDELLENTLTDIWGDSKNE